MLLFPITLEDERWAEEVYPSYILVLNRWFAHLSDKGGAPYINHLLHVASRQHSWARKIIALCHDSLEDILTAEQEFIDSGMPPSIHTRIQLLTRNYAASHAEGEAAQALRQSYDDYIKAIAEDFICLEIKLDDLEHNMQVHRLPQFGSEEISLLKRYHKAYIYLKGQYEHSRSAHYSRLAGTVRTGTDQ